MKPSERHRAEYERRLHRVLAYIDAHLDEPIDLAALARLAAFSPFHFHRLFAVHTSETLGAYLTRRRVETAAARLAAQPRLGILEVALAVGFGSPEAFARAFKKHFGEPPSRWRERRPLTLAQSKAGQTNRSPDQASPACLGYSRGMAQSPTPLRVTTKSLPTTRLAYLRYQGPFGEPLGRFWRDEVYPWMVAHDLLGAPRYGVSQDDPKITAQGRCRYDAGVEVPRDFVPSQSAQVATLPGGRYACTRFRGTSAEVPAVWDRILREWLPASGYRLDARPFFEYYPVDGEFDEKTGAFTCDLCVPIAPL